MRTGAIRRTATAALWGLTIVLLVTLAARFKRNGDVRSYLPAVGDPVPLDTIGRLFRLDAEALEAPHARWLLVLSSSCPACLALDDELTQMQRAATCEGADLVPLIVEWGAPPDSMATVLRTHGLEPRGLSGPDGFLALRVRAVPTILSIDARGDGVRHLRARAAGVATFASVLTRAHACGPIAYLVRAAGVGAIPLPRIVRANDARYQHFPLEARGVAGS